MVARGTWNVEGGGSFGIEAGQQQCALDLGAGYRELKVDAT
jgi:hypothetical protein